MVLVYVELVVRQPPAPATCDAAQLRAASLHVRQTETASMDTTAPRDNASPKSRMVRAAIPPTSAFRTTAITDSAALQASVVQRPMTVRMATCVPHTRATTSSAPCNSQPVYNVRRAPAFPTYFHRQRPVTRQVNASMAVHKPTALVPILASSTDVI